MDFNNIPMLQMMIKKMAWLSRLTEVISQNVTHSDTPGFRAKGYKMLEARTGEAAMELKGVVEDPIDLLITDAVMPEMDGPTLIKNIWDTKPGLPVICISGYAEENFRNRLGEDRDIDFLPKPFSLAQLAGKVKEVMERVPA